MSNMVEFTKKKTISLGEKPMYRVVDIKSPFFNWEGWLEETIVTDRGEFIKILCAHSGFQFPHLTFGKNQVIQVPRKDK